jgi:hypothetical protein
MKPVLMKCSICGHTILSKLPKHGDGNFIVPRKHKRWEYSKGCLEYCPGEYRGEKITWNSTLYNLHTFGVGSISEIVISLRPAIERPPDN